MNIILKNDYSFNVSFCDDMFLSSNTKLIRNNSISSYINKRYYPMWISLVYNKTREFIDLYIRINPWIAHIRNRVPDNRPGPYDNATMVNSAYIMCTLRHLSFYI